MTTKTIDVSKTKVLWDELLALISQGTEVILTDGAKVLARVVPANGGVHVSQRVPDLFPGSIWTSDDFDAPLPDEFWAGDS
jgi:antitoxin (DNA-binding transcriptional repressor) of toxin-antitoxin stability system